LKAGKQILKWAIIFCLSFVTFNWFISGKIESTIEINAPVEDVYLQVVDLQTWPTWAVWWVRDTAMTTEYSGEKSGKGAKMSWKSSEGDGSLEILECTYASSIYNELLFEGMPPSYGVWKFEKTKNGTKVTWGFKDELPFLMHFMQLFITPDLKDGLEGLKKVCEVHNNLPSRSSEVEVQDWTEQNYIYIENTCVKADISSSLGLTYGKLFGFISENGLDALSMPFAKWISYPANPDDEDIVIFQASVMIDKDALDIMLAKKHGIVDSWVADPYKHLLEKEYGIMSDKTIEGKTLQATHFGSYEMSAKTHRKIYEFADANEISLTDIPYEFYTNDPTTVAPEDVETLIVYEIIN